MKLKEQTRVICGDSLEHVAKLDNESVDLFLSDIPYGISADTWDVLHSNTNSALLGSSPAQKKAGAVFKSRGKPINGWSEADRRIPKEYQDWCGKWAGDWFRVLKPGGSAIIFAGRRLSHRCIFAMEDAGFSFKDMIAWMRGRAPHRAQRLSVVYDKRGDSESAEQWEGWRLGNLKPTFEPILWFTKPYKIGTTIADNVLTYGVGAYNQEAFVKYSSRAENVLSCDFIPGEGNKHPTQKPVSLMRALIELTTTEGQLVVDPFCGSGTTLVAAQQLNRRSLGIEQSEEYVELSNSRLNAPMLF